MKSGAQTEIYGGISLSELGYEAGFPHPTALHQSDCSCINPLVGGFGPFELADSICQSL